MKPESKNIDYQNDWAYNDDFTRHIHISEAKRGLNGYYCLGCKKEMQAVKGLKRAHYYRHHAINVDKDTTECVVASRKYRELIARDILQRLKELKVPDVYKFPPKGQDGSPMLLQSSETIKAYKVKSELTFYEDENCNVKFGQNPEIDKRFLLIRPDITFFNEMEEPILLIEFVVSHKIDDEKKLKLKRLGLNTVQIIIPKKPETEIEKALKSRSKVKWVYNESEANTKYIFISETTDNGVRSIDDNQREIFEESYKCRASQIKYLIRTVKRALESQSYKRTEQLFESEISRVKKSTRTEQKRLEEMEARIDKEVRSQFKGQKIPYERQRGELDKAENEFQEYFANLERRYKSKKREIGAKQEAVDNDKRAELEIGWSEETVRERFREDSERLRVEFEKISKEFGQLIQAERRSISELLLEKEELPGEHRKLEREELDRLTRRKNEIKKSIEEEFRLEEEIISKDIEKEERIIGELRDKERALSQKFKQLEDREQKSFREKEARISEEGELSEESIFKRLLEEVKSPTNRLPKRFKFILEAKRVGHDYKDAQRQEKRYKRAREFFNKGTWQKK
ncbi:coiled-coil domain-containing protein [Marixanthomonas spongiae]|uniref:Uncharacterized protein n=1 Tax=Marixanthomonas spongiae TaxID=2174845 RepID=A0A2U0HT37_9FLAO|nr:hypothetical protein [Marixanthomonas spongiae]PVW11999.1 hypothetical protein DDV96_15385 [Marixanthomonas spongiae]